MHLAADTTLYAEARKTLGAEASIGVFCGFSRDDAMRLAEAGADYVAFGPTDEGDSDAIDQCAELIAWWSEIFVVPCIAWNVGNAEERRAAPLAAPISSRPRSASGAMTSPRLIAEIDRAIRASRRSA